MKTCTRFHFEDVERGDRLVLIKDADDPDSERHEITVRMTFRTVNFGPVIQADGDGMFYVDDYDSISLA